MEKDVTLFETINSCLEDAFLLLKPHQEGTTSK